MTKKELSGQQQPDDPGSLAKRFRNLGWLGFWIQLALIAIPVILLIYLLFFSGPESAQRRGIDLSNYLSNGSLLVMVFTTFWFFRYTRLAKQIVDPELCPPQSSIIRTLWVGLWAGFLGIMFSMLLMLSAVGRLLFVLMANPQTGLQIAPTPGGDPSLSVSAMDAVSLTALLSILTAEFIVLAFSLWLLFRVTRPSTYSTDTKTDDQDLQASDQ